MTGTGRASRGAAGRGQFQRLTLARALAAETEVVLADDVSSALDARTEVEVEV